MEVHGKTFPTQQWFLQKEPLHWTEDRKFEKFVKDTKGQVDIKRCLAQAILAINTNS